MNKSKLLKIVVGLGVVVVVLGAGLALDLANQGLAWRLFWSLTGEEEPLAQVRGMVEWAGNAIRPQPNTAPLVPINHVDVNPYGINTFLQLEVEPQKREQQIQMIADMGIHWLRQEFPWEDIEIHGRGDFVHRRNDPNGVDAWAKYDQIVDLAEQYSLELQVRLSNPPRWTHSNPDGGDFAPPDNIQDYVNYAVTVAERYQGRVSYFQLWNEPNIYPEWGNYDINPEAYTTMLCETYAALKAVDPNIVVISGALAPTVALTGRDLNDFVFLQRMYDAGAGECFDVLAMNGYGLNSGPTDYRLRPTTVNYARHVYIRDIMVANGDEHKPIWISEAGWNPVPEPSEVAEIDARYNFGQVTDEQAARYAPIAYQRAQEDWPWLGPMFYWFFRLPDESRANEFMYYFRFADPDFTPRPIYDSMREYITNQTPTLYAGVHQAEDWAVTLADDAEMVEVEGAQFDRAAETTQATFTVRGTQVAIRWQGDGPLRVVIDCSDAVTFTAAGDGWHTTTVSVSQIFAAQTRHICLESDAPLILDSITVIDRTFENLFGLAAGAVIIGGAFEIVLMWALWRRRHP